MSDDTTYADFAALDEAKEYYKAVADGLQRELANMERELQRHLGEWEGAARDQYWVYKAQWDSAAARMHQITMGFHLATHTAHENYKVANNFGVSLFS